jgi:DNA-binding YbaB/EbfC family protein
VKITMTGKYDVKRVEIAADLLQEDKEVLEDLIAAAVNDAVRKVESVSQEKMSGATAGMGLPAGMKLPF